MGIYVYAVFMLTPERLVFAGAWEKYEDAVAFTGGDYEEGADIAGSKKWRIAQINHMTHERILEQRTEEI